MDLAVATRRGSAFAGTPRTPSIRPFAVLLAIVALLFAGLTLAAPSPARAANSTIDTVAATLKTNPVYVDPAAPSQLTPDQVASLTSQVTSMSSGVRTFIAVLPDTAEFHKSSLLNDLYQRVGVQGVYAATVGTKINALDFSRALRTGEADAIAKASTTGNRGNLDGVLTTFVRNLDSAALVDASGKGSTRPNAPAPAKKSSSPSVVPALVGIAGVAAIGGGGYLVYSRRKKARIAAQRAADLQRVRAVVDEDITAYGEVLDELDFNPSDPRATTEMRQDYAKALDQYEAAKNAAAAAKQPSDMSQVTEALEEGRFALATLTARRMGQPLPVRRPPCFFDPRHGPSVADVTWTPPGGAPRAVPACQADLFRVEQGQQPDVRTVQTQYGPQPYYNAGPAYGPWAGGYFGGGILPALVVGTMMGSFIGGGHDTYIENNYYGDGGGGGGWGDGGSGGSGWGDSGGGSDWGGGGDSGGSDWGGGGGGGDW